MGILNTVGLILGTLSGVWIPATLLCCVPWVQKQMLYLHWLTLWPGKWLEEPERAGFLRAYARDAQEFIDEKTGADRDIKERLAFKLLREDPEARLLIYCRSWPQRRRTEEYRSYAAGASDRVFVLSFDYRGFGKSSGTPSEAGLLTDGIAAVEWAMEVAGVPAKRIVLLGHSLGTAVTVGVAHHFGTRSDPIVFAGVVLCAAFTNAGNAFSSYGLADIVPVLAPVNLFPAFQKWFSRRMCDPWPTDARLAQLVRHAEDVNLHLRLVFVHAQDDMTMPSKQTEALFLTAVRAAAADQTLDPSPDQPLPGLKTQAVDLGEAGSEEIWRAGKTSITKLIAKHGDHSTMMKWSPISLAVLQCFELTDLRAMR
ncbi:alpha/beta-hydrolase [Sporormia fimetaria CBS 119925]|uniref:Alpha/beta-hydrolase n=1 Tax=Sporormia fimetaria CBS 119925 TaxID=1340428 RepID=A0A6A6UXT2_9PLEO|nr:alpha/beta-hydrolase [Sporormia fimetaria CBS 119925]